MADAPDRDEQTEAPTPKRRADAARQGDILQSRELNVALVMTAGAGWMAWSGPAFIEACMAALREGLSFRSADLAHFSPSTHLLRLLQPLLPPLASLFMLSLIAAILGPALLGSSGFRIGAIGFKLSRINPGNGLKRMFGINGVAELGKAILKVLLLGGIGLWFVRDHLVLMQGLASSPMSPSLDIMGNAVRQSFFSLCGGLLLIAGSDVPIQILRRNARLRMTKQQLKEEMRQSDGAPELKQAQRQRQHEILAGSARKAVTEATVILTNPTHFAIALRYRPGLDSVPMIVARGRGEVALAIRSLGRDRGVPTLEYPQLTRAIYFTGRTGQAIPEDLFLAVATILAFVFRLDRALGERQRPPTVIVPDTHHYDEHGHR